MYTSHQEPYIKIDLLNEHLLENLVIKLNDISNESSDEYEY